MQFRDALQRARAYWIDGCGSLHMRVGRERLDKWACERARGVTLGRSVPGGRILPFAGFHLGGGGGEASPPPPQKKKRRKEKRRERERERGR